MSWTKGDRVVHATKPEWGVGHVLLTESVSGAGGPHQRLTIRFERAGTKAISTEFAELKPAGEMPLRTDAPVDADGLSFAPTNGELKEIMTKLPERATDPFTTLQKRLAATLDLYRYTDGGGLLLDWAVMQTGLKDPLSRFNRHELEQWFARFRIELDEHLKRVVRDLRKHDPASIETVAAAASPVAKQALRRADMGR
ncbi:MAG: DUF3553 domain-containing protein [Planctomycetes bacterium]|nr:DUF3553 domain-containing protein [Planctomycetota bacterium]